MQSAKGWVSDHASPLTPDEVRNEKQYEESAKRCDARSLLRLEYQLMKIVQYRSNNATMLIQYGFSKTGFDSLLRHIITLIVTVIESIATMVLRSSSFSILVSPFTYIIALSAHFYYINCKMLFW